MMDAEEIAHLKRLRDQYERNVWKLKEQAAEYGLDVPLSVTNGIEEFEAKVADIDRQLARAEAQQAAAPLAVAPVMASAAQAIDVAPAAVAPSGTAAVPGAPASPPPAPAAPTAQDGSHTPRKAVLYSGIASLLIGLAWSATTVNGSAGAGFFLVLGFGLVVGWLIFVAYQRRSRRGQ